jgi:hypothetical protein
MIYQQKFNVWTDGFVEPVDITLIPCAITSSPKALVNTAQPMPYEEISDKQRVLDTVRHYAPSDFSDYPINVPGL